MNAKDDYAQQLQAQIVAWQKQLNDYQKLIQESTSSLRETHEKNLAVIETALKQATDIQQQISDANETAWSHMQTSTEEAIKQLANGWLDAISSYRPDK